MRRAGLSLLCLLCLCLVALVTGCGSTVSGSDGGSFSLTADTAVTIAQGQSRTFTVTASSSNSFSGSVQVSVSGMPSGVTLSPASVSATPGTSTTFTLIAAADAAVGTSNLVVQGISGTLNAQTTVSLTVTATTPPTSGDFTLGVAPGTVTLTPGASQQVTLSATATGDFSGTIAVLVKNLPSGVTASPTTITVVPNAPEAITLTAASDAPATTPIQVSFVGTSGTLSHTATIQVSVSLVADFSITATPNTMTVGQGVQSGEIDVAVTGSNGFAGSVTYTVSGLPAGVTMTPPTSTLESGWVEPIVFEATQNAAIGNATVTITGTSGVLTHTATVALTVTGPPPADFVAVGLSPASETITTGSIGTVSVTATATEGYTGLVSVSVENLPAGVTVLPATAALTPGVPQTFTIVAAANATLGTSTLTFLGQVNSVTGSAPLSVTIVSPANAGPDVPTWHNDLGRTGLNASETVLTPTSVNSTGFGKKSSETTDGAVDAQPLYLSGLTIGAQSHNVLYAATENDTVYAWDADSGAQIWRTSAVEANETASDNQGCSELPSQVGITSTPVIDRYFAPDGAIYFVAKTKDSGGNYHQRLHALDLVTGAELNGSPVEIAATYPANGGQTNTFDPGIFVEKAALLVSNGMVYLSWAAPCQETSFNYDGWVMAYNEGTLAQESVLDVTLNGSGGGIWMSGAGPAADANGNVFLITSKGTFDTTLDTNGKPQNSDYGNGYLKIQSTNGVMSVVDYFEPLNGVPGSANYQDQGSGGVMLMPQFVDGSTTIPSLLIGAGQDDNIYLTVDNGTPLGGYGGTGNKNTATLTGALPNGATSSPATLGGKFYYGASSDALKMFDITTSLTPTSRSTNTLGASGATPAISANGASTAIVWALDTTASGGAVLYAYDATNLATELYSSSTQATRDAVGATSKHAVPTVANGHVYVGTESGVDVFGLLP
ncbi:MAG TPA: hypothetical protein VGM02_10785 [Acidobacteriaceae bacterium]|jgi:hypothetical protein